MNLEQTIKDTVIAESQDLDGRLQQLVRAGLMPSNTIPVLRKAIAKVQGGMTLQGAERDVMANFINSMMFIVLGDDSIFNKARAGAKTYATEAKEKTEYDYEGDMAMGQLKSIIANSKRMHDMLSDDTNLPEWVQSKITLAEDYISTASNYMQGEMNEEQIDELSGATLGSYVVKSKKDEKDRKEHGIKVRDDLRKATGMNFGTPIDRKLYSPTASRGAGQNRAIKKLTGQARVNAKEEVQIDEVLPLVAGAAARYAAGKAGAGLVGRTVAGSATKYAVSKSMNKEEVEVIDELSKKTMGSYIKKASGAEKPKNVMDPKNVPLTKIAAYQGDSETGHFGKRFNQATYDKAERLHKNRSQGITRAADKLAKEEVEQVDEISSDMAHRYLKGKRERDYDISADGKSSKLKKPQSFAKMNKDMMGSMRALKTIERTKKANEEVEQVDEISKKTMGRYINKAKDSIDMTSYRSGIKDGTAISSSTPYKSNNPLERKLTKRHKGISMAVKKLTKEDIDTAKSMHESYKNKFDAALEHYNIKSPSELDESKRKEFFNHVDQEFKKGDN
jgi:hypothetical protein